VCSKKSEDHLIKSFEEHEDSVYCVSWGTSAWVFSSLSYDGRVVVNYVPKEYRDLILL
jgi:WD40 repeat protein